jgi:hypothetical protein
MFHITDGFARFFSVANLSRLYRQSECRTGGAKNGQIWRLFVMIEGFSAAIQWQVDRESGRRKAGAACSENRAFDGAPCRERRVQGYCLLYVKARAARALYRRPGGDRDLPLASR